MKSVTILTLLATVAVSLGADECADGNCTQAVPVLSVDIGSIFPFFSPVEVDSDSSSDESEDLQPRVNRSHPAQEDGLISINFMEVISFTDDDSPAGPVLPDFQFLFDRSHLFENFGILDLSGKNLTGAEIAAQLRDRQLTNRPVLSLILSNTRVRGLSSDSFLPVETTLRELHMDNCTVSLEALYRLTNLRVLNLSYTGLTTFEWYPQLRDTLEILDLSHNQLTEVRPELSVLTSLRELYLSYNRIASVNEYPLVLLPNLEVISLTMNAISKATFSSLRNLILVEVDWNYLWRFGYELELPSQRLSVKLDSNPWRCDCGIMQAKDSYDVLDMDTLKCATHEVYSLCYDCDSHGYLPGENGQLVSSLTKESIEHLGCTGITDQWFLFVKGFERVRDHEPEKLLRLGLIVLFTVLAAIAILLLRQSCKKKKFDRRSWLKIQQVPFLNIEKFAKPQEVPYIKIDSPNFDTKA